MRIGGFDTYVSLPEGSFPKDKAILLLPDAFGIQLSNNKVSNGFDPKCEPES